MAPMPVRRDLCVVQRAGVVTRIHAGCVLQWPSFSAALELRGRPGLRIHARRSWRAAE